MLEQPAAAPGAAETRQNAGVRGGIDHPVGFRQRGAITGGAQVAMGEFHAQPLKPRAIGLRAGTHQIVDAGHANAIEAFQQVLSKRASHEAADARNQNLHADCAARRFCQLAASSSKITGRVFVMPQPG